MALMVGVSGVRGLVGDTFTPELVLQFARAYGTFLDGGRVVLGMDSRPSGPLYALAAATGLMAAGCEVTQLGIAMTPTVGRTIQADGYAGGMSITASHNPIPWNGLKFFDQRGLGPAPEEFRQVVEIRDSEGFRPLAMPLPALQTDSDAGRRHVQAVLQELEVDLASLKGTKVVLDSVNGAGCADSPALLDALGCTLIHINDEPTGIFSHPPEPLRENLSQLCDVVCRAGAAVGFAQDPDADRLAIVDEKGEYIGEEYTLALAVLSVLSRRPGPVAANLSTSRMIDDIAARFGVPVVRTPVGESHVAHGMLDAGCVIGGEGNGGVIDPRVCLIRDSLSAMSLVLQLMAATGQTISQLVADLPRYASIKEKFECPRDRVTAAVAAVTDQFADHQPNTADGVRVDFPEGWVHLRASNTEPIVRFIAEAKDPAAADRLVGQVRAAAGL